MPQKTTLTQLTLVGIAYRCRRETQRFWNGVPHDPRYCYDLFRRALATPSQESSKEAWNLVHHQYHRQVTIWVKRHRLFPQTGMEPEALADLALEKMWVSFALSSDKFGRFPIADPDKCLRALLRFLQTCVHSVVIDALQKVETEETVPPQTSTSDVDPVEIREFWRCIYQRLNSDEERLVMDASFVYGLKPRQIYEMYRHRFDNVNVIYRIKENVLARFKRDSSLHDCLGERL